MRVHLRGSAVLAVDWSDACWVSPPACAKPSRGGPVVVGVEEVPSQVILSVARELDEVIGQRLGRIQMLQG